MATIKRAKKSTARTNAAGRKLMAALTELKEARRTGDYSGMVIRLVQIAEPGRHTPAAVRALRHQLSLTQRLFAALIGVSVELVEHWEQGRREPGTLARRLLDEIARDPQHWQSMVRRSA